MCLRIPSCASPPSPYLSSSPFSRPLPRWRVNLVALLRLPLRLVLLGLGYHWIKVGGTSARERNCATSSRQPLVTVTQEGAQGQPRRKREREKRRAFQRGCEKGMCKR